MALIALPQLAKEVRSSSNSLEYDTGLRSPSLPADSASSELDTVWAKPAGFLP
jgi:hypothetical protein